MRLFKRLVFTVCAALPFGIQVVTAAQAIPATAPPVLQIGAGDQVRIEVFGNPDLTTTVNVTDEGAIRLPLAGAVNVSGQSPAEAARRIENALKAGDFLVNPQVTVTVTQSLSQRVTVLGEIGTPGRYSIESNTTLLEVIALAGGLTPKGSELIYILRADPTGALQRLPVDLRRIFASEDSSTAAVMTLRGGDSIIVPKGTFSISGQVAQPGEYRVEGDMLLSEAIARAGGLTPAGSSSRIQVQRRDAKDKVTKVKVNKSLRIQPGDVVIVKERIF